MPASPNGAAARQIVIPMQTANISRSTPSNHKKTWRIWSGACFAVVLLAVFAQPLLALINYAAGSQFDSYILLVPFVSAFDPARDLASKSRRWSNGHFLL
jgi:hypothetical protein